MQKSFKLLRITISLIIVFGFVGGVVGFVRAEKLTLEECIALAKKGNLELRSAYNSYRSSKENVWQSYSGILPRIDSWISGSRTVIGPTGYLRWDQNTSRFVNASTGISVSKSYSAGISLSETIFNGGANIYNIYSAKADKESKRYQYIKTEKDIIYSVKEKYYNLLKAKMMVDVRKDGVKRGEEQLKYAQSRYELGAASISDVLKAKVQYGQDKLDLVDAKNTYNLAKADLNNILNRPIDSDIEPVDEFTTPKVNYDYESAYKAALERQPILLQASQDLKTAKYRKLSARGGWLPSLSVRGSYAWNDESLHLGKIFDENYQWNITGTLNFNIFEGFQTKAQYNSSKIAYKMAEDNFHSVRNAVALEVMQAYLGIQKSRENMKLTEESRKSAEEDYNIVKEKYTLGAATILDLIDAEVSYKQAEANHIQALYDYNLAVSQLEKAIGL